MKKKCTNKAKIIFVKDRPGHDLRYALDSSKIRKNLIGNQKLIY
jgi:dTDP-D-glucose 4,6-dehydratase